MQFLNRNWLKLILMYCLILAPVLALQPQAQAPTGRVRVKDRILTPGGQPRVGKVTFVLLQAAVGPNGLIPAKSSVSAELDLQGWFDVWIYPSTSVSPQGYYNVLFQPSGSVTTENLGVYSFPNSTAILTLAPNRVTDTNLQARYKLADDTTVQNLAATAATAAATTATEVAAAETTRILTEGLSPNAIPRYDATQGKFVNNAGSADSLPINNGDGTVTWVHKDAITFATPGTPIVTAPDATLDMKGKAELGLIPAYTISSLPTCNASRVNRQVRVTDGNRGMRVCKNVSGTTYKWTDPSGGVFDVRDFGAVGDGTTDDSTAINAADTAAAEVGGIVRFSVRGDGSGPTVYVLGTAAIELKQGVTYEGAAPSLASAASSVRGVYVKPTGAFYAFQNNGAAMNGLTIRNLAIDLTDPDALGAVYAYGTSYSKFEAIRIRLDQSFSSTRKHVFRFRGGAFGAYGNTFTNCDIYNQGIQGGLATGFLFEDSANNNYVMNTLASGIDQPYVVDGTNAITFVNAGGDFGIFRTFTFQNNARQNTVIGGRSEHGSIAATLTRASNVVTATHDGSFRVQVGQEIRVATAGDNSFVTAATSEVLVASVISATQFTYNQTGANATTTGTVNPGQILYYSDGSYNNSAFGVQQVAAPRGVKDENTVYGNSVYLSDNLGQFNTNTSIALGNSGNRIHGTTITAPGNIRSDDTVVGNGFTSGVGFQISSNKALRMPSTNVADQLFLDVPNITFRNSASSLSTYATLTPTQFQSPSFRATGNSGLAFLFDGSPAIRASSTTAATTLFMDVPRIEFRDISAGYATVGKNTNGAWQFNSLQVGSGAIFTDSNAIPAITTGTAAPATTPARVGLIYLDTTNKKMYISMGTTSSTDWVIQN